MQQLIQQHLSRARLRMKAQADKQRAKRTFDLNDWVYLKLQPYVQSSLAPRSNQKLAYSFFGPFQIIDKIGAAAYRLALPASSLIHPIFHVSQLKRAIPRNTEVADLPTALDSHQFPERVLQRGWYLEVMFSHHKFW